jgi:S-adenosylmethionine/arginine decarboxylase-like enzyme
MPNLFLCPVPDPLILPAPRSFCGALATHRSGQAEPSRFFILPEGGSSLDGGGVFLPPPAANDPGGNRPFGRSLHFDAYGIPPTLCDDISFCYSLLDDLTKYLGMSQQAPPFVFLSPAEQYPDKAGISGWVPLNESGISIHTLTLTGFVSIDAYTCGELEVDATVHWLCDRLQPTAVEYQLLIRGKNYHGGPPRT